MVCFVFFLIILLENLTENEAEPTKAPEESKKELPASQNCKIIEEMGGELAVLRTNTKKLENENMKLKSELAMANKWKDKSAEVVERVLTLSSTLAQVFF